MSENSSAATKRIVAYWKSLGQQLSVPELTTYSDNGPVRGILRDMLDEQGYLPQEVVEIGALYAPLSVEMGGFSRMLLIDPIYAEKGHPDFGPNIVTSSTPLPESLSDIAEWLQDNGVLVLENVINYFDRGVVGALLQQNFSHVIVGNNSGAHFGDMHPNRLGSPKEIQKTFNQHSFVSAKEPFLSRDTLVGIYTRYI